MNTSTPHRPRFAHPWRWLIAGVLAVIALPLGLAGWWYAGIVRDHRTLARLGGVQMAFENTAKTLPFPAPEWPGVWPRWPAPPFLLKPQSVTFEGEFTGQRLSPAEAAEFAGAGDRLGIPRVELHGPVEDLAPFARIAGLRKLYLDGPQPPGCRIADLATADGLTQLRFTGGSGVTDTDLAALARLPRLERLMIDEADITDAAIPALEAMPSLIRLNVRNVPLSHPALQALAARKPGFTFQKRDAPSLIVNPQHPSAAILPPSQQHETRDSAQNGSLAVAADSQRGGRVAADRGGGVWGVE